MIQFLRAWREGKHFVYYIVSRVMQVVVRHETLERWFNTYFKKISPALWQRLRNLAKHPVTKSKISAAADLGVYEQQIYQALTRAIQRRRRTQ
jgi:hypothetical protein